MSLQILEKTAWPKHPIDTYTSIEAGEWGYLVFYSDKTFSFTEDKPSKAEISARWGQYFKTEGST